MLISILSWVLGFSSLPGLWLAGRHDWRGWALMLATEPVWAWFAILTHGWGILLAAVAYSAVSIWNIMKWRREQRGAN